MRDCCRSFACGPADGRLRWRAGGPSCCARMQCSARRIPSPKHPSTPPFENLWLGLGRLKATRLCSRSMTTVGPQNVGGVQHLSLRTTQTKVAGAPGFSHSAIWQAGGLAKPGQAALCPGAQYDPHRCAGCFAF